MEEILDLGSGVFGLLSLPPTHRARQTVVVLFNSGIMHRPGPFRMNVRLARALSAQGYATLRFDSPGVGDSLQAADQAMNQIVSEIFDRMQARTGCNSFVVGGLCSAADLGWQVALIDPRVVGVLLLDGLARKGWWYTFGRVSRMLRKPPSAWLNTVRRHLTPRLPDWSTADNLRDWPPPGDEREQLRQLLSRGVRLFMAFTGGTSYFLHPRQFRETYGAAATAAEIEFNYWPQCDHMFYAEADRERLIATVCDWMSRCFR